MATPNKFPARYTASDEGLYTLRGGPLCGLRVDLDPAKDPVIELVWTRFDGVNFLVEYGFVPTDLLYSFIRTKRFAFG